MMRVNCGDFEERRNFLKFFFVIPREKRENTRGEAKKKRDSYFYCDSYSTTLTHHSYSHRW